MKKGASGGGHALFTTEVASLPFSRTHMTGIINRVEMMFKTTLIPGLNREKLYNFSGLVTWSPFIAPCQPSQTAQEIRVLRTVVGKGDDKRQPRSVRTTASNTVVASSAMPTR